MAYNENMTAAVDPASLAAYYSIRRCPWFRSSSTVRRSTTIDSYSPTSTRDDHRVCSLNLRSHTRSNAEPVRHAKQARRLQQPNTCWPNEERTDTPGIIKHAQTHSFCIATSVDSRHHRGAHSPLSLVNLLGRSKRVSLCNNKEQQRRRMNSLGNHVLPYRAQSRCWYTEKPLTMRAQCAWTLETRHVHSMDHWIWRQLACKHPPLPHLS